MTFLKRNPVYLLEMVLMGLKYMKVFLILIIGTRFVDPPFFYDFLIHHLYGMLSL
jgi:hypothetical protein